MRIIGGREIHPVNVRVGGSRAHARRFAPAAAELEAVRDFARDATPHGGLPFPRSRRLPLRRAARARPLRDRVGPLVSTAGLDLAPAVRGALRRGARQHSTALYLRLRSGQRPSSGLPRWSLNRDRLPAHVLEAADAAGLEPVVTNPNRSIVVRAVETYFAVEEALRLTPNTSRRSRRRFLVPPRSATGCWSEVPRGLIWHRYAIGDDGTVLTRGSSRRRPRTRRSSRACAPPSSATSTRPTPSCAPLRADRAQLRPVHLVRRTSSRSRSTAGIGVGNAWRRDDGAGPAVARGRGQYTDDPARLLDLWDGAAHVALIDACVGRRRDDPPRRRRPAARTLSTHGSASPTRSSCAPPGGCRAA